MMNSTDKEPEEDRLDQASGPDDRSSAKLADSLKLFSDPTRLRLLKMLTQNGEMNVNAICSELGQSQPAVSHHLALLRIADVIVRRREGKFNFYSPRRSALQGLVTQLSEVFV